MSKNILYDKINEIIRDLTPLTVDCGVLCGGACCKGDKNTGMRLFPFEESELNVQVTDDGIRLAVCNGTCDRRERPLACKIFPFFPTIDDDGKIYVEFDYRAYRLCPMIEHRDELLFDPEFLEAVEKIGYILAEDEECRVFLYESTEEIDTYFSFYNPEE